MSAISQLERNVNLARYDSSKANKKPQSSAEKIGGKILGNGDGWTEVSRQKGKVIKQTLATNPKVQEALKLANLSPSLEPMSRFAAMAKQNRAWTEVLKGVHEEAELLYQSLRALVGDFSTDSDGLAPEAEAARNALALEAEKNEIFEICEEALPTKNSTILHATLVNDLKRLDVPFNSAKTNLGQRTLDNQEAADTLVKLMSKDHIAKNEQAHKILGDIEDSWNEFSLMLETVNWEINILKRHFQVLLDVKSLSVSFQKFDMNARILRDMPHASKDLSPILKDLVLTYESSNQRLSTLKQQMIDCGLTLNSIAMDEKQLIGYINFQEGVKQKNSDNLSVAANQANAMKQELLSLLSGCWSGAVTILGETGLKIAQLGDKQNSGYFSSLIPRTKMFYAFGIASAPTVTIKEGLKEGVTYDLVPSEPGDLSFLAK